MNEYTYIAIGLLIVALIGRRLWSNYSQLVIVWEHELALHFSKGKFVALLPAGEHRLWGRHQEVTRLDRRWQEHVIQGQEFLTADKVPVKVTGLVRFRIVDAQLYTNASSNAWQTLYSAVQLALRDVVGSLGVDGVLGRQEDFSAMLKALVASTAEKLGCELDAVLVRDLMISGDLKRVYTQAVTAKQEALAGLEKARGEAAAIRVMANAARVFEQHPALLQLRFLQTLENASGHNHQLFMGPLDPLMSFLKK